jgi:hypothetical protein
VNLLASIKYNVDEEMTRASPEAVWNASRNIRDYQKIAINGKVCG